MLGQSLSDYWGLLSAGKQLDINTQRTEWHQYMKSLLSLGLCSDVKLLSVFRFSSSLWCLQPPCFLLKKHPLSLQLNPANHITEQTSGGCSCSRLKTCTKNLSIMTLEIQSWLIRGDKGGQRVPVDASGKLLAPRSASRKLILAILAEMITHICSRNGSMYFEQVCRTCGARVAGGEVWPR